MTAGVGGRGGEWMGGEWWQTEDIRSLWDIIMKKDIVKRQESSGSEEAANSKPSYIYCRTLERYQNWRHHF